MKKIGGWLMMAEHVTGEWHGLDPYPKKLVIYI
jgi:hypothetical protein